MLVVPILSLFALTVFCFVRYRASSLSHPAVWFSASWVFAIISYHLLNWRGEVPVYNWALLKDLSNYITFTAAGFFVAIVFEAVVLRHRAPQIWRPYDIDYVVFSRDISIAVLACISIIGSISNWIGTGANLDYNNDLRSQWLTEIPRITALTWNLYIAIFPAIILSSAAVSESLFGGRKLSRTFYFLQVVIALSALLWTIGTGGRQSMGIAILLMMSSAAVFCARFHSMKFIADNKRMANITIMAVIAVTIFGAFISYTGTRRAEQQGSSYRGAFYDVPVLSSFDQFIVYNGLTIATYQAYGVPARRNLSETGPATFGGLFMFGTRDLLGWRPLSSYDTNPEREMAQGGYFLSFGTRNIFYDLEADFGQIGAFLAIMIMCFTSQIIFACARVSRKLNPIVLVCACMSIMFWAYSHQFSLLMFDTSRWILIAICGWWLGVLMLRTLSGRRPYLER